MGFQQIKRTLQMTLRDSSSLSAWVVKYLEVFLNDICQALLFIFRVAINLKQSMNKKERTKISI